MNQEEITIKNNKLIKSSIGLIILAAMIIGVCFINVSASEMSPLGIPAADVPPAKLQAEIKEQQLISAMKNNTADKAYVNINSAAPVTDYIDSTDSSAEKGPTGILNVTDLGTAPLPGGCFLANNGWVGYLNSVGTSIYAGYSTPNPNQGMVVVAQFSIQNIHSFSTSGLDGGLTVTKANGNVLTLTAKDGAVYTFDMNKMALTRQ